MGNNTEINPIVNSTIINPELTQSTSINTEISTSTVKIPEGTILSNKYKVIKPLEVQSGEADLYLCISGNKEYVAKVYRRKRAVKKEVVKLLMSIKSPYIAQLYAAGIYNEYQYEILPYYKNGSIQGKRFSFAELKDTIIPDINEALRVLHSNDIIHKDLKPSNIMLADDGKNIAIIDFGISSVIEDGNTVLVTKTGMTPEYSAPETFRNLFLNESDYYSFGITLYELFCGSTPYTNMSSEQIEQYVAVQRIPFPDDMPVELQDLIVALTYNDISYRRNKKNPNRRWTYKEVNDWLNGEDLPIPGEGLGGLSKGNIPAFQFHGESYTDMLSLVKSLAVNWEEGKKQLFRGNLTAYFRPFDREATKICQQAEEEASRKNGKDDVVYWNLLYKLYPKLTGFYWKGKSYENLTSFGRDVLDKLWKKDESEYAYYESVLSEKCLSLYVQIVFPKNEQLKKATTAIEDSYELEKIGETNFLKTFYLMAYTLSGQKLFVFNGQQFRTVGELSGYLKTVLEFSYDHFESLCHSLVDYDGNLDLQLETWLIAIGKQKEIDKWKELINE